MNRRAFSSFFVAALVLIFSTVTASAQQPRAVPPNDNIASATAIKIGKNYKVPEIEEATNEVDEPLATCRSIPIPHSVWFTFSVPVGSTISLSTFGTHLVRENTDSMNTVLAIYELVGPGDFPQRACADDLNGVYANAVFAATANANYYIAVGTYSKDPLLPESTLKLSTKMLSNVIVPPDQSFEGTLEADGWTLKNGADDQIVCGDPTYVAVSGACAFRFTGTPGVTTRLSQTLAFPSFFKPRKDAVVTVGFVTRIADAAALENTKIKLIVQYKDGTPPTVSKINLSGTAASPGYTTRSRYTFLASPKVASVKLLFKYGESSGTLLVDSTGYFYIADIATRGLLPVPPAAGEKQ